MPSRRGRGVHRKQLPVRNLLAQQGVNLIESVVLAIRCRWQPTVALDSGIDGHIELTDRAEEPHPLGLVLHVQSRATDQSWPNEDAKRFTYTPSEDDLAYWLQGNAPVLLIVSRPRTNEAYWISIKDYFRDAASRRARRITFDKSRDEFRTETYEALFALGRSEGNKDRGLYLGLPPTHERLTSNLLPVAHFGPRLYVAETWHRTREQVFAALKAVGQDEGDIGVFVPSGKMLISPYDLTTDPWPLVCERGTVEEFDAREWADSADPDRQREYARLLRLALRELLWPAVRLWPTQNLFAFRALDEDRDRRFGFAIRGRRRQPAVVRVYSWTFEEQRYVRYRHLALDPAFRRDDRNWFVELTPSYLFTRDGREIDGRHEQLLAGIKRLERQPAVLRHVELWAAYLTRPAELTRPTYPYLSFGDLVTAEASFGIPDHAWRSWDEPADESAAPELLPEQLWS